MAEHLELPKKRDLFLNKQVDQDSIGELTQRIIEINNDDDHLKKLYPIYGARKRLRRKAFVASLLNFSQNRNTKRLFLNTCTVL